MNAAYLGRRQINLRGTLLLKKGPHIGLIAQIQFGVGAGDDVLCRYAAGKQGAHNGAAHHTPVAGYINRLARLRHGLIPRSR